MYLYCDNDTDFKVTLTNALTGAAITTGALKLTLADTTQTGLITNVTNSGVSPIVITSASHGLSTGDHVCVMNVVGNKAANGPQTVTRIDANTFSLDGTTGSGDWKDTSASATNPATDAPACYKTVPGVHNQSVSVYSSNLYVFEIANTINLISGRQYIGYLCETTSGDVRQVSITGRTAKV